LIYVYLYLYLSLPKNCWTTALGSVACALATGVARNHDWGRSPKWKKLWHYFGDVFLCRSCDDVTETKS